uniref:ENTH domain-containing protein n=2 Tax=Chaetoceros debilis TaxID=122233 RepID=A0A7S3VA38_9STRA
MKFSTAFVVLVVATASVEARRPSGGSGGGRGPPPRRSGSSQSGRGSGSGSGSRKAAAPQPRSRRPLPPDDYDEEPVDEFDFGGFPGEEEADDDGDGYDNEYDIDDEDQYDDFEEEPPSSPSRRQSRQSERAPPSRRGGRDRGGESQSRGGSGRGSSSRARSSRSGSRGSSGRSSGGGGNVVPYGNRRGNSRAAPQPSAFTRGLSALRESIPDASSIKDSAFNSISAAKDTTSKLSSNFYREIKGLTSSELEQVMLKATQPNDVPVKGTHVERLVGVTYQISGRYDIYDAVLRKLWSKMIEKDWRTTIKALYILHRFSADGAPDHQAALKARLRELRRTRDPKRKEKYFNSKQLLAGDNTPANLAYRAFLGRYAHYVLLRAQCFGGVFAEIANDPSKAAKPKSGSKSSSKQQQQKSITSTCLKNEHLEASQMLLKAGLSCAMKEEEECENTAIALERVVSDLIGLTTAVAKALNNALDQFDGDDDNMDRELVKKWCIFYSEDLLPQTKKMVKSTSPALDAYGLYLPSRMGTSVPQDLLQKGLKGADIGGIGNDIVESEDDSIAANASDDVPDRSEQMYEREREVEPEDDFNAEDEEDENLYDEYEYDEYEYDEE